MSYKWKKKELKLLTCTRLKSHHLEYIDFFGIEQYQKQ